MPLGASITQGFKSSDGNGYRKELFDLLEESGYTVDMVGSKQDGTMADNDHEGWIGLRVTQIMEKAELSVPDRLPNVFTVNAGTNDCLQNRDVTHIDDRMESLINYLFEASPQSTVILSTLVYNADTAVEECTQTVNKQYLALAEKLQGKSKKIVLADMQSSDGPQPSEMVDGTHPNDEGYKKMAKIWLKAIEDAESWGWIESPSSLKDNDQPSKTSSTKVDSSTTTEPTSADSSSTARAEATQTKSQASSEPTRLDSAANQRTERSVATRALVMGIAALVVF